ncbi:hypothetical protein AOLI_G00297770 [Acnodon oligacanthus]
MLEYIDDLEAELLGRDVMSAADEAEASTHNLQTHLDETDPANDQPLGFFVLLCCKIRLDMERKGRRKSFRLDSKEAAAGTNHQDLQR